MAPVSFESLIIYLCLHDINPSCADFDILVYYISKEILTVTSGQLSFVFDSISLAFWWHYFYVIHEYIWNIENYGNMPQYGNSVKV